MNSSGSWNASTFVLVTSASGFRTTSRASGLVLTVCTSMCAYPRRVSSFHAVWIVRTFRGNFARAHSLQFFDLLFGQDERLPFDAGRLGKGHRKGRFLALEDAPSGRSRQ